MAFSDEKIFSSLLNKFKASSDFRIFFFLWENEHLSPYILFHFSMYFEIHPREMMLVYPTSLTPWCLKQLRHTIGTINYSCFMEMNKSHIIYTRLERSIVLKLTCLQILFVFKEISNDGSVFFYVSQKNCSTLSCIPCSAW